MSCINDDIIQKYVDGETTPEEVALIEKHIVNCEKCTEKVENQRRLADSIKKALDLLVEDPVEIPMIRATPSQSRKRLIPGKKLIYSLSAACILIFVLFITQNKKHRIENEEIIVHSLDWEYDANRTITQQQMVINIIDLEGNVTEYFIE
jgi:predicted anti-sigma-YlaC factor YlaD